MIATTNMNKATKRSASSTKVPTNKIIANAHTPITIMSLTSKDHTTLLF